MSRAGARIAPAAVIAAVVVGTSAAIAGDAPNPFQNVEEVIVTATKRELPLQLAPLAISAVTGDQLDFLGLRDFNDYLNRVPGLAAIDQGPGRKRYILRGVSNQDSNLSQATVAQYFDEVPITNSFGNQPDPHLIDIERVEVLRGPQGTLFGARSMAGAIRTVTRKPKMDVVEGNAALTGSLTRFGGGNVNVEGVVNAPVAAGKAAVRASAFYQRDSGYVDNVFAGGTFTPFPGQLPPGIPPNPPPVTLPAYNKSNVSWSRFYGGRVSGRWTPSDRLTVDLTGLAVRGKLNAPPLYNVALTGNESNGLILGVTGNLGNTDNLSIGSATAQYDLDWAEVTAVGAYARRTNYVQDVVQAAGPNIGPGAGSTTAFGNIVRSWTTELRIASRGPGRFHWLVGGYGFWQSGFGNMRQYVGYGNTTIVNIEITDRIHEHAVFGELSYDFSDQIEATVGARYSGYRLHHSQFNIVPPPGAVVGADPNHPGANEDSPTFKFEGSYHPSEEIFLYALVSEGFRPGGYNGNASVSPGVIPALFKSDKLWNYELGAKTKWADGRLTANVSVYRINWTGIQVLSQAPNPFGPGTQPFTTNASSAEIIGMELETSARLSQSFSVDAAVNHFFKAALTANAPRSPTGFAPLAGDRLPYNSEWSFNLGAEFRQPLSEALQGFVRVDLSYVGARTTGFRPRLDNGAQNTAYNSFPAYSLVDLRVGVNAGEWQASLFANNLFDERPIVFQQNHIVPVTVTLRNTRTPRTIGATIRRDF